MIRLSLGLLLILAHGSARAGDPEFAIDVMSVLSKAGCNAGTCHGNLNGKGGFKLSLRGQDAGHDYHSLVHASRGRRVNRTTPQLSLFLQKASGIVAHRGGIRLAEEVTGLPVVGPQLWTSAYLPGAHQGSYIRNTEDEPAKLVPFLENDLRSSAEQQEQVELLGRLNRLHLEREGGAPELEATIHSMETAFRMQTEATDAFDIRKESEPTREMYGDGDFARGCLLAT